MKLSLMNIHELAMNRIRTYQVHNSSSQYMKLSVMNLNELAMNRIKTYQVHNNSSQYMKLSVMNFNELAMNELGLIKFITIHHSSWNCPL